MTAVSEISPQIGVAAACKALAVPRSSFYRKRKSISAKATTLTVAPSLTVAPKVDPVTVDPVTVDPSLTVAPTAVTVDPSLTVAVDPVTVDPFLTAPTMDPVSVDPFLTVDESMGNAIASCAAPVTKCSPRSLSDEEKTVVREILNSPR